MSRNEELNRILDKLLPSKKLKRLVNRYIEKGNLITKCINEELRPDGELDSDLVKTLTDEQQTEANALLDLLLSVIEATAPIKEINENLNEVNTTDDTVEVETEQ